MLFIIMLYDIPTLFSSDLWFQHQCLGLIFWVFTLIVVTSIPWPASVVMSSIYSSRKILALTSNIKPNNTKTPPFNLAKSIPHPIHTKITPNICYSNDVTISRNLPGKTSLWPRHIEKWITVPCKSIPMHWESNLAQYLMWITDQQVDTEGNHRFSLEHIFETTYLVSLLRGWTTFPLISLFSIGLAATYPNPDVCSIILSFHLLIPLLFQTLMIFRIFYANYCLS